MSIFDKSRYVNNVAAGSYFGRGGLVLAYSEFLWLYGVDGNNHEHYRLIAKEATNLCITNGAGGW